MIDLGIIGLIEDKYVKRPANKRGAHKTRY